MNTNHESSYEDSRELVECTVGHYLDIVNPLFHLKRLSIYNISPNNDTNTRPVLMHHVSSQNDALVQSLEQRNIQFYRWTSRVSEPEHPKLSKITQAPPGTTTERLSSQSKSRSNSQQRVHRYSSHRTNTVEGTISVISQTEINKPTGMSWIAAVFIVANCTVGMGILNFPRGYMVAGGILPAFLFQTLLVSLMMCSLVVVIYVSRYYGDVSYQGVIGSHLGRIPKIICRICILFGNFGILVVLLVVIGDQCENVTRAIWHNYEGKLKFLLKRTFLVPVLSIIFIFPLCLLRRFDIFKYTSFIGIFASSFVAFGLVLTRYINENKFNPPLEPEPPTGIIKMIPLVSFAFEFHVEMPPLIACLKRHDLPYILRTIFGYILLSSFMYSFVGSVGYLTFGIDTPDDILTAYRPDDVLLIVAMVLLAIKIMTTYPVTFFCIRSVVDELLINYQCSPIFQKIICPFLLFAITVILSVLVPNITTVIGVIGSVSVIFIFIFPGICLLKLFENRNGLRSYIIIFLSCFLIVFGVFLLFMNLTQTIQSFITD